MYEKFFKRIIDFILSLLGIIILSPIFIILIVSGTFFMRGNPFFTQLRPGKDEKIFRLIKFRTMDNRKDSNGNLLPDDVRLNRYGKFLRSTSLDELPELFNILKGDMAIVGPRPLLVSYLPWYTEREQHRHDVRSGLTGLAQINGRNYIGWDERLELDVQYVENITLWTDVVIIIKTVFKIIKKQDIAVDTNKIESNLASERLSKNKIEGNNEYINIKRRN